MLNYQFGLTFAGTINNEGADNQNTYYIFPNINLQAEVLKRTLAVYGGWDGRAQQQTLSALLANVPVISGDQALVSPARTGDMSECKARWQENFSIASKVLWLLS